MSGQGKRLMVMAGGTGGHVFPGLAVAHHLMAQGWQVRWLGTADRMEADLVPKHGIEIDFIRISGLRGKGIKALIAAPLRIFNAWRQARAIMKAYKPDVVLGMGGYVSGPGGLAAWSLGIPVVLHEQNGIAGLTNKWLAKIATKVMQAFPGAFPNAEVVGNPVRTDVLALPLPQQRLAGREGPVRVLVVGGSQGARILNQTMPQVAAKLGDSVTIWHQSGKGSQQSVEQAYAEAGQPQHKVRQQYWNALPLEKAGAAKIIEQSQLSVDAVANTLAGWSREILLTMAERARAASIPDATERVANEVSRAARA